MMKAANVLAVNPFDESHKDAIIKGIESSKLDVQITSEAESVLVTLGAIPDDMKNESLQQIKKLNEAAKEDIKNLRHNLLTEMKKLEKILGKDEAKRIEKGLVDVIEKSSKMAEQTYKKKEEEIKSS
jgi:ribosome recycling factor